MKVKRVLGLGWAMLAAAILTAIAGSPARPARADTFAGLERVGTISLPTYGGVQPVVDASARRLVLICESENSGLFGDDLSTCGNQKQNGSFTYPKAYPPAPQPVIRSWDLDTLRPAVTLGPAEDPILDGGIKLLPWALDERRHVYFQGWQVNQNGSNTNHLLGFDTRTLKLVRDFTLSSTPLISTSSNFPNGIYYSPQRDVLYAASGNTGGAGNGVTFSAIDPVSGQVLWTDSVPQCSGLYTGEYYVQTALGETSDGRYLVTACYLRNQNPKSLLTSPVGVVRLPLPANPRQALGTWTGQSDSFPGITGGPENSGVWIPRYDRLAVQGGGQASKTLYIFDANTGVYVSAPSVLTIPGGATQLSVAQPPAIGFDPVSGRVYSQGYEYGEDPSHCEYVVPGSNSISTVEAGVLKNEVATYPTGADRMNSSYRQMAFDPVRRNLWMVDWGDIIDSEDGCHSAARQQHRAATGDYRYPGTERALVVWHDASPAAGEDQQPNYDAATQDISEVPGVTGANFAGQASAYGVRYFNTPGGVEGATSSPSFTAGQPDYSCDEPTAFNNIIGSIWGLAGDLTVHSVPLPPRPAPFPVPAQYGNVCNPDSRTIWLAHVPAVVVDGSEAHSLAVTGDSDSKTAADLSAGTDLSHPGPYLDGVSGWFGQQPACQGPSGDRCVPPGELSAYTSGEAMPYTPAKCSDIGGDPTAGAPHQDPVAPWGTQTAQTYPGYAEVLCDEANGRALAQSEVDGAAVSIGSAFTASSSITSVRVARDPSAGMVATATAIVKGIDLAGLVHIGSLTETASAVAHGRPGTAAARLSCVVTGVSIWTPSGTQDLGGARDCQDPQLQQAVAAFNQTFAGWLVLEFPQPYEDPATAPLGRRGIVRFASPGGYLAQVQASELRQNQDAILLADRSIEQPGLVLTYINDTAAANNRFLVTFGAVAASAKYGIYELPPSGACADPTTCGGTDSGLNGLNLPAPPAPVLSASGGLEAPSPGALFTAVMQGFRFLWAHPDRIPAVAAVWLLLLTPAYLANRVSSLSRVTA